jgi:hypothetical protein
MNGSSVVTAANDLGVRFRLVSLLPATVLALFVLGLVWSGAPAHSPDLGQIAAHADRVKGWTGFLLAIAVLAVAVIVEPLQLTLVRGLEGYWGESRLGRALATPGKLIHRAWRGHLDAVQQQRGQGKQRPLAVREAAAWGLQQYPPAEAVLPTKLGNIMRAGEYRAGSRYGLDALTAWPRLYPLLSDKVTAVVNDLRDQLDLSARFCAVFLLATVISVFFLASFGWWLAVPAATLLLAWLSYRSALTAAAGYGQAVATAFDLHRFDLLTALHLPLPADLTSEVAANQQLSRFLQQPTEYLFAVTHDLEDNLSYDHGNDLASAAAGGLARAAPPSGQTDPRWASLLARVKARFSGHPQAPG